MSQEAILAAAKYAPTSATVKMCISKGDGLGRYRAATLLSNEGRLNAADASALWENGTCKAEKAELVAALCEDSKMLLRMVAKEKRQGTLALLGQNQAMPLVGVLQALRKLSSSNKYQLDRLAHTRLTTEPLDESTFAACLKANPRKTTTAVVSRDDLTPEKALELLENLEVRIFAADALVARKDLAELGLPVIAKILELDRYGAALALAYHPRLFELGEEVMAYIFEKEGTTDLAERRDLPAEVQERIVQYLVEGSVRNKRLLSHWNTILSNPTFPREVLLRATCSAKAGEILGCVLMNRYGTNTVKWELGLGLYESFLGKTFQELVNTIDALSGE